MIERYVRSGQVKLVFRDVLNHGERSLRASEAAACAGRQGRFWHMHEILFQRQPEVERASGTALVALMRQFAAEIPDLDQAAFSSCLTGHETLAGLQAADAEQRARGIRSQPIFEIGPRRLLGYQSLESIGAAIDAHR